MPITDIPLFSTLKTQMRWLQERQRVLAENIANADTPSFQPKDLAPLDNGNTLPGTTGSLALARTSANHLTLASDGETTFAVNRRGKFEVRPDGNGVNLEDQMMKVAANQMDYQSATALYSRSLGLIKLAIGKGG
ncbi:MAG TPA: flagellar basal body rod protein FlgB [Xanthobacteraceae bacterium]|jgi:flagellar basal-body rod protein FlgB|nr:flagellar basal body rod protein FlgB [Xanthobacteraceae bacterium]